MIKYYAYFRTIRAVEVERESDSSVWINGRRNSKKTDWNGYFDTWAQAKEFLLDNAQKELDEIRRELERAQGEYSNIKGLKE